MSSSDDGLDKIRHAYRQFIAASFELLAKVEDVKTDIARLQKSFLKEEWPLWEGMTQTAREDVLAEFAVELAELHKAQGYIWVHPVSEIQRLLEASELRSMRYVDYLRSHEWKATRAQALKRARYRCQLCGETRKTLDVHHNDYERIGCEDPADLIVLCRDCHDRHHSLLAGARP